MKVLAKDRTTGARKKPMIPCTLNPGTKNAAIEKQIPFTTSEKAPKLRKLIGNDRVDKTGLADPLIKPMTKAAIIAAGKLAMLTPGTTKSTINRLKAVATVVKNVPILIFLQQTETLTFKALSL